MFGQSTVGLLSPDIDPLELLSAPYHLVIAVMDVFRRAGVPEEKLMAKMVEHFQSESVLGVPFVHLRSCAHAGTACRAAHGKRRPPDRGYTYDVEFICHHLPYCDAMFIDNKMRALLTENPVRDRLPWKPRLFSANNFDEFFAHLDELEKAVPDDVRRYAEMLYGPQ